VTIEMVYSEKFKSRMVAKMVGPHGVSASTLAGDVGINQPTLSRWLREARTVPDMAKKSRRTKEKARPKRPQDWSPEEKLRVVVESRGLTDEELGAFLRKEGLHQAQVEEWSATAHSSLLARKGAKKASAESKRIRELERELRRKEKALAEAAALLILKKKAQEIWGDEEDDTELRSGR
jgi:transposase-like protein